MTPAVLALHGFTATPECLESLVIPLREAGFSVEAPLLAGHGTSAFDLEKTSWQDWYRGVVEAYLRLKKKTDEIYVVGLSLGGLLSLKLATEYPVRKLALLATPIFFKGFVMEKILPLIGGGPLRHLYRYQPKFLGPAIRDPEGKKKFKSYFLMPVASVLEIIRLQETVRPLLASVHAPALIIHAVHDTTAPYESLAYLKDHLGSATIRTVTLEQSNHVLTLDYEKDLVAREVVTFFKEDTYPNKLGRSDH